MDLATLTGFCSDEEKAIELFERWRWPDGPVCPFCRSHEAYRLTSKPGSQHKLRAGVLKCKACRKKFTAKVGTVFEDSHIPVGKWMLAMYLLCSSKKGMSSHQLHRSLGVTYKTAW